ncbi:hypothetical protein ABE85_18045 [Mitsuaria sp. 7]|nr:hypothetical protein ABE85_18045 [Mitsuaria sp. 7]
MNWTAFDFRLESACTYSLIALAALIGTACSKPPPPTFTLSTGIEVIEASPCQDASKAQSLVLKRQEADYIVDVVGPASCSGTLVDPYLTLSVDHKATLVLREKDDAWFSSGCECQRALKIKVSGRLEKGDTLYVSHDGEVAGHFLIE